jgi:excisionase family DNA binding protein
MPRLGGRFNQGTPGNPGFRLVLLECVLGGERRSTVPRGSQPRKCGSSGPVRTSETLSGGARRCSGPVPEGSPVGRPLGPTSHSSGRISTSHRPPALLSGLPRTGIGNLRSPNPVAVLRRAVDCAVSTPDLASLARDPKRIDTLSPEALPALLGEVETLRARLWSRLQTSAVPQPVPTPSHDGTADRLLTVAQVAERLGVTKRWVYRRVGKLPFARRIGAGTLRFSERGLERWQARQ